MDIVVVPIMSALEAIASGLTAIGAPYAFGFAIIIFTLIIKLITYPLNAKQIKSSKAMQEMQPQLKELQKKYKDNKEELAKRQMELYREAGVNPLGGCLPTLIQFPIWIGLYQALFRLAGSGKLTGGFLWIPDLAQPANSGWLLTSPANWDLAFVGAYIVLPILTIVTQLLLQKMMTPTDGDPQAKSMSQMMMLMPLMFGFFAIQVPAGLTLYWVTMNIFSMVQQYLTAGWGGLARKPKETVPATPKAKGVEAGPAGSGSQKKGKASRGRKKQKR